MREIRATRAAFAADHNYDPYAMVGTLRAMSAADTTRSVVNLRAEKQTQSNSGANGFGSESTIPREPMYSESDLRLVPEEDDIMKEIRATREKFAADYGYDIHRMFETFRAHAAADASRPTVNFSRQPVTTRVGGVATPATPSPSPAPAP